MPRPPSIKVGDVFNSKSTGTYEVVEYVSSKKALIKFHATGYEYYADSQPIRKGQVYDPYHRSVYGVGFVGKGSYRYSRDTKAHNCWDAMLARCYNVTHPSYKNYGERGVSVCDEWLNFQNFTVWYYDNYREGQALEKDIKGGSTYSPDNCLFVPQKLNNVVIFHMTTGVTRHQGKYRAYVYHGRRIELGMYENYEEARNAYVLAKKAIIKDVAKECLVEGSITQEVYALTITYAENL